MDNRQSVADMLKAVAILVSAAATLAALWTIIALILATWIKAAWNLFLYIWRLPWW